MKNISIFVIISTTIISAFYMAQGNRINKDCVIHKRICDHFCTSSKCANKILCERCIQDHLEVHPRQFIYTMQNLLSIHSFDKVNKMKEILGKYKVMNQQRITKIYNLLQNILEPLIARLKQFTIYSKSAIQKQLIQYLLKNKTIIEKTRIQKSNTNEIRNNPQLMVEQTIKQVQTINERQIELKANTQKYTFYADATEQLCQTAQIQLKSLVKTGITLLNNLTKIQGSKYSEKDVGRQSHHEESFIKRYVNSHQVASKAERNHIQMTLIQSKKQMLRKDQEIKRTKNQIKEKVTKIQQLNDKISGLSEQLLQWQQKLQRQQRERQQAAGRERKKLQQYLIKNDVISNDVHLISLQKKVLEDKYINLVLELVTDPTELILSQHHLTKSQLPLFYKCHSIQIFRMSFIPVDKQFLSQALKNFQNLHTLELNSAQINDDTLLQLAPKITNKLKHLHLIDNKITDDGLDFMFKNFKDHTNHIESLFVSYNSLTSRSIDIIKRECFEIRVLHISKNQIKSSGVKQIATFLKDIQQLFIGGTGVQKEGYLAISRHCLKLKRLSLVANQITPQIISQLLVSLPKLEWLDISYTGLNQSDLQKVQKFKIFNQGVQIVTHV